MLCSFLLLVRSTCRCYHNLVQGLPILHTSSTSGLDSHALMDEPRSLCSQTGRLATWSWCSLPSPANARCRNRSHCCCGLDVDDHRMIARCCRHASVVVRCHSRRRCLEMMQFVTQQGIRSSLVFRNFCIHSSIQPQILSVIQWHHEFADLFLFFLRQQFLVFWFHFEQSLFHLRGSLLRSRIIAGVFALL